MTRVKKGTSYLIGAGVAFAMIGLAVASVFSGSMHMSLAGLEVSVANQAERGLVVRIDGADCPGKGCPAFALDWKIQERG